MVAPFALLVLLLKVSAIAILWLWEAFGPVFIDVIGFLSIGLNRCWLGCVFAIHWVGSVKDDLLGNNGREVGLIALGSKLLALVVLSLTAFIALFKLVRVIQHW
jgi:hypothetical protein